MIRALPAAVALSLAAAVAQGQSASDPSNWESALNPFPPVASSTYDPFQLDDPSALGSPATHSNTRLVVSSREWGDDLLDEVFGSTLSIGVEHDSRTADSGPGWEVGLFGSFNDESASASGIGSASLDVLLIELMVGGRYTLRLGRSDFYAYAAGGADGAFSYVDASATLEGLGSGSANTTDFSLGGYAHLGAYYQAGNSLTLGLDLRQTFATKIEDVDADYLQIGLTLGYGR